MMFILSKSEHISDVFFSFELEVAQPEVKHKCLTISNYFLLFSRIMAIIYADSGAKTS